MRNRVVYVKQIELLFFRDGGHLRGQRQRVRLMLEQRIRHHLHFVKTHMLVQFREPRGQRRRDEMDGMTARGEFLAEFRSHDTAAAVRGIYRDADVHRSLNSAWFVECEATSVSR